MTNPILSESAKPADDERSTMSRGAKAKQVVTSFRKALFGSKKSKDPNIKTVDTQKTSQMESAPAEEPPAAEPVAETEATEEEPESKEEDAEEPETDVKEEEEKETEGGKEEIGEETKEDLKGEIEGAAAAIFEKSVYEEGKEEKEKDGSACFNCTIL